MKPQAGSPSGSCATKKSHKKAMVIGIAAAFAALFAALLLWAFVIYPNFIDKSEDSNDSPSYEEIAQTLVNVDFDETTGALYVNNEVVVYANMDASGESINALFSQYDADVDDSMADIALYTLTFKNSMAYEQIEALVADLEANDLIDEAYPNLVTVANADVEDSFDYKDAQYPNDEWNSASWNVNVPRDENWGMEAINAPGAWGYLDQLQEVNVGLIDSRPNGNHDDLTFERVELNLNADEGASVRATPEDMAVDDHGSHVAGTIAADYNNGSGVSGVIGDIAKLYYSRSYDVEASGERYETTVTWLQSIKSLVDQDVRVINISMGFSDGTLIYAASKGNQSAIDNIEAGATFLESGLKRIISKRENEKKSDFLICVAAGNTNDDTFYPNDNSAYGYSTEPVGFWQTLWAAFYQESGGVLAQYGLWFSQIDDETVKNRIVVVGAVGIDSSDSTSTRTRYSYSVYSNVGNRVDIVAPGGSGGDSDKIYSCYASGYGGMCGTSMATPHVSGVAGLCFAANPSLTGPEVKQILTSTATGRYYYSGGSSGMVNACDAVIAALKTKQTSVKRVLNGGSDGLDLCFVVDTTSSMGDDIADAQSNMTQILASLASKTENYRVALIDYRDFSSRTGDTDDYAYKVQLGFSEDNTAITSAINALTLGSGGDHKETVYSGLMAASALDWRDGAKKVIIVLGDAAPLDPEPQTGYTYDSVVSALVGEGISIDYDSSDERVFGELDLDSISVYTIGTSASTDAVDFLEDIAQDTGGSFAETNDASEVSDAIMQSIDQIELAQSVTSYVDMGAEMAGCNISLYAEDGSYLFTFATDASGIFVLDDMPQGAYTWTSDGIVPAGTLEIAGDEQQAIISTSQEYDVSGIVLAWRQNSGWVLLGFVALLALCIAIPVAVGKVRTAIFAAADAARQRKTTNARGIQGAISGDKARPSFGSGFLAGSKRYCLHCGAALKRNAAFCANCGKRVKDDNAG